MQDFLYFRKMMTPVLIRILFWSGTVLFFFGGLLALVMGGAEARMAGFLAMFVAPFILRIWCELVIVIFSINDTLTDIKNQQEAKAE